jgi:hypothetical protein
MSLLGLWLLVSGCATVVISPEPYACPPLEDIHLSEYSNLMDMPEVPSSSLRAWIREADKACRANEQLLKAAHP